MNDKRIIKNTIILYFRMIFQMIVYLYTSRVVINALGFVDYGIYDVVGSVVIAMMFLNNSMLNCTQRYITFTLAENDDAKLCNVFSHALLMHILLGICIVIAGAIAGTFYIQEFMVLPSGKVDDALFVFYVALASAFVTIVSVPYNAMIIAHEHMGAFALITIVDVVLKLIVALSLFLFGHDRLRMYALLLLAAALIVRIIYGVYCHRAYRNVRFTPEFDRNLFKNMLGFLGWNTIGNTAVMCNTQGLNLMLNAVGGPVVNAARGLAFQVQTATVSFINSFQTAINPQIIKNCAVKDYIKMNSLVLVSSRVSFLLMLFITVPLMLMTENLLTIWVSEYPDYTPVFVRLLLCVSIVETVANPLMVGASATGNIKKYQLLVGGCMLCTMPLAFMALRSGAEPQAVFWALLATTLLAQAVRMLLCRGLFGFSSADFLVKVLVPLFKVCAVCVVPLVLLRECYEDSGLTGTLLTCVAIDVWVAICVFALGLTSSERDFVLKKIRVR